ncbi:MAG: T9SS type A sorting domain-containing protein [Bacteroidetes bacterium]|nr:T9SS type A sorting domain-containing protein [Bacteroidota bacterium]
MKTFILTLCCFLATIFVTTATFAGNNGNEKGAAKKSSASVPYKMIATNAVAITPTDCCVQACPKGATCPISIPCNGSHVLGQSCIDMSCSAGVDCPTSWSWSPSTFLSSTTVQQPTAHRCGGQQNTTITYTCTASGSTCNTASSTIQVTYQGSTSCQCGGSPPRFSEQGNDNVEVVSNAGTVTVNFKSAEDNTMIEIYDMNGNLIKKESAAGKTNVKIDLGSQVKGMYFVKVLHGNTQMVSKQINIK